MNKQQRQATHVFLNIWCTNADKWTDQQERDFNVAIERLEGLPIDDFFQLCQTKHSSLATIFDQDGLTGITLQELIDNYPIDELAIWWSDAELLEFRKIVEEELRTWDYDIRKALRENAQTRFTLRR